MKLHRLILVLFCAGCILALKNEVLFKSEENRDISIISAVLKQTVIKYFAMDENKLVINLVRGLSWNTLQIINRFVMESEGQFVCEIQSHLPGPMYFIFNFPTILIFETLYDFISMEKYYTTYRHNDKPMIYICYIAKMNIAEFESSILFKIYRRLSLTANGIFLYGLFIINEINTVALATIEWFTSNACNHAQLKVLNIFDKETKTWNTELKHNEKFLNYHECELVMAISIPETGIVEQVSAYAILNKDMTNISVHGITPKVFEIGSKFFNYSTGFQPAKLPSNFIFDMNYMVQFIEINGNPKYPLVYFCTHSIHDFNYKISMTNTFVDIKEYVFVTPAKTYSAYEKFALPFDKLTWILLFVTFFVTCLTIVIINQLAKPAQRIVYGYKINNPFWNVLCIFFGISQTRLPSQHFPRFILMLFIGFCLIFRTCFQSKFFEFMTSEPRQPPPKTFSDLIDANYKIYVQFSGAQEIRKRTADQYGRRLNTTIISVHDFLTLYMTQSQNDSGKFALFVDEFLNNYYEEKLKKDFQWNRLEERAYVMLEAFTFTSYSFYYRMFNKLINNFIDTGVINYLVENYYTKKSQFQKIKRKPQILSLKDLSFGFNIWLVCCLLSVMGFFSEKAYIYLKNIKK